MNRVALRHALSGFFAIAAACVTASPSPDEATEAAAPEEAPAKPLEAATPSGRSRFDLPGECSTKLTVSHGIDDMAECEGLLGDTKSMDLAVSAIAADPDAIDARIRLTGGPAILGDGTLHGTFTDGRPTTEGDLTFGRFSGEFGTGPQVFGFVLRERAGLDAQWIFHITGGSGCLVNARGELKLLDRSHGTLRLESPLVDACGRVAAAQATSATADPPLAADAGTASLRPQDAGVADGKRSKRDAPPKPNK